MKSSMLIALLFLSAAALAQPPEGMVLIEGGTFHMGIEGGKDNPRHEVTVSSFYMDATEVTNAEYKAFCEANKRTLPIFWGMDVFRSGDDWPDHPIVGVSHSAAKAYAEWAGKRLPTEAEWEYAARGGLADLPFPNGDEPDTLSINHKRAGHDGSLPVGSLRPNGYGLHDMAGNVREWVADRYGRHYYLDGPDTDPTGPEAGRFYVIRGGGWYSGLMCCRNEGRNALASNWGDFAVGFRCAMDVEGGAE